MPIRTLVARLAASCLLLIIVAGPPQGVLAQQTRTITFNEAVRIALEHNIALQRAANETEIQAINVDRARSRFLPDLNFSTNAGQSYGRTFSQDEGRIIDETVESFNFRGSTNINLFNGFADMANLRQARLRLEEGDLQFERRRQTTIFNVISNYLALIERREQMRVLEENLSVQRQQLEQVEEFTRVGVRPISDLYQQQAEVAGAELNLLNAERAFDLAQVALIQTLGLEPYGVYEFVVPELDESRLDPRTLNLDQLMQQAFAARPELQAAERSIAASEEGIRIARSNMLPSIGLGAGYGSNYSSASSFSLADQLDQRRGGSVGFNVSVPLFDRFTTRNNVQQARVQHNNARLGLDEARQTVALEVRQAYLDYLTAEKRLQVTEVQVAAASQSLEATQERYNVGATTLLELARATSAHMQAQSNRVQAMYDFLFREKLIEYYLGSLDPQLALF
jgi:outer membrane protein